jgi:pyochelin biosynthetic protein PchC
MLLAGTRVGPIPRSAYTTQMGTVSGGDVWVRRFHVGPTNGKRLICFPHAGGSASFYLPLSRDVSGSVELLAVQYPGRQDRLVEPPIHDIAGLADAATAAMRPWLAERPALFGHSMGAIVAFEVARRMERDLGVTPARLVVSGHRAPSRPRPGPPRRLDDESLVNELIGLGGTDAELLAEPEVRSLILPALRSDYRAIDAYIGPRDAVLRCPITAFGGDRDARVSVADIDAWRRHTAATFDRHMFAGGHFYLSDYPAAFTRRLLDSL